MTSTHVKQLAYLSFMSHAHLIGWLLPSWLNYFISIINIFNFCFGLIVIKYKLQNLSMSGCNKKYVNFWNKYILKIQGISPWLTISNDMKSGPLIRISSVNNLNWEKSQNFNRCEMCGISNCLTSQLRKTWWFYRFSTRSID